MMRWMLVLVGAASILSFVEYWRDKRAAIAGRRRVRESTLHLLDLVGANVGLNAAIVFLVSR